MKISPVAGTPTIPQPSSTGLAPEKLARIKGIASGNPVVTPAPTEEDKSKLLEATQKIQMQVNKTPEAVPAPTEPTTPLVEQENALSDTGVQATEGSEATQPISPQLAALAKQRRALQVKERELAEKEKALNNPGQTRSELEARIKSQPLSVLQELGVTYDQLTQEILGQTSNYNPEVEKLKAEIEELKKGVDSKFTKAEEAQEAHVINYVADKLDSLIAANPGDFELLTSADEGEEVVLRMYKHWKETGKERDIKEVALEVQNELIEEAVRYAKLGLVQKKLTPSEPAQVTPTNPQPGIKTLTNKDSARPAMGRRERAILAMRGELKR